MAKILVERHDGKTSLAPLHVIVVRVASFAFRFETVERLRECIKYYVQRWFERLPIYLLEEPKRQKVLKVLSKALTLAETRKL